MLMIRSKRKETFIRALRLYTLLVTLITVALMILGYLLDRDRVFGYEAFFSPLLYALIGTAATLVTWPGRELSVRSLIIRKVISLLLIEGAIILLALNSDTIPTDQSWVLPGLVLGILAVFLLTHIILYLADRKEAERLSADLARYQEKQINESAV
jgi:hypothetical protein